MYVYLRPRKHEKGEGGGGHYQETKYMRKRCGGRNVVEGKNIECVESKKKGLLLRCACSPLRWRLLRNQFRKRVTPF